MSTDKETDASQEAKPIAANAPADAASPIAPAKRANLYTHNAEEALNAAELINSALKKRVLGSVVARRVEVTSPSGPSTAGGKKARQSITLVQTSAQGPVVVIGFLDVTLKSAGVREYDVVAKQYEARFRSAFETSAEEYQALTKDLLGMLTTLGYKLMPDEPREDARISAPSPEPVADSKKPFVIAGAVLLGALLCLLLTRC